MKQLKAAFRSRSPRPPTPSQSSGAPSHDSDALASIIAVLKVAENSLDGLPINTPKAVISSIRSVLQSVKVGDIASVSYKCCINDLVPSNQVITNMRSISFMSKFVSSTRVYFSLSEVVSKCRRL